MLATSTSCCSHCDRRLNLIYLHQHFSNLLIHGVPMSLSLYNGECVFILTTSSSIYLSGGSNFYFTCEHHSLYITSIHIASKTSPRRLE